MGVIQNTSATSAENEFWVGTGAGASMWMILKGLAWDPEVHGWLVYGGALHAMPLYLCQGEDVCWVEGGRGEVAGIERISFRREVMGRSCI